MIFTNDNNWLPDFGGRFFEQSLLTYILLPQQLLKQGFEHQLWWYFEGINKDIGFEFKNVGEGEASLVDRAMLLQIKADKEGKIIKIYNFVHNREICTIVMVPERGTKMKNQRSKFKSIHFFLPHHCQDNFCGKCSSERIFC